MSSRLFTIPDIHGRNDLLQELLRHLKEDKQLDLTSDKLIFLADYIDRGPDSKGVLQTVKELTEKHPNNVIALRGNHEDMGIKACVHDNWDYRHLWIMNGGDATSLSYGHVNCYMDPEHIKWLASLPLYHEEPGFFFSHAPVPAEEYRDVFYKGTNKYSVHELTWTYFPLIDEEEMSKKFDNGVVGVCGHIHRIREGLNQPRMYPHYIFADSGCGCHSKAPLTCVEVKSREIITIWPAEAMETES